MAGRKSLCGFGTSFDAKRWLSLDPCGCMGISLSWGVHLYAIAVLVTKVIPGQSWSIAVFCALYLPVSVLAMISLFQASTTDPGAVPLGARPFTTVRRAASGELTPDTAARKRSIRRCHKCSDNFKPNRAHHDSVTGRCIVKFDHFCPWVNAPIGALNHKFFCLFLLYTALSCILSLVLLLMRLVHCGSVHKDSMKRIDEGPVRVYRLLAETGWTQIDDVRQLSLSGCKDFYGDHFVTGLAIASLVFLIFTTAMGCEQLEAIETGKGKIARMKMAVGNSGTEYSRVTEEFNEMFGGDSPRPQWHWYLPLQVKFPRGMKQVVLGYEFNETCAPVPYQEPGEADLEAGLKEPPPAVPENDHLFSREASDVSLGSRSIKNRRLNSTASDDDDDDEGISLVERTKTRLA